MKIKNLIWMSTLVVIAVLSSIPAGAAEPSNSEYSCVPIFQVNATQPSILILLDNSGSMNFTAYSYNHYDPNIKYYGYFEPGAKYSYASGVFTRNTSGLWSGNFLNWAVMRRIDVARKVLIGGKATERTGGGNQINIGENSLTGRDYTISNGQKDIWGATPYPNKYFSFYVTGGNFKFRYRDTSYSSWYSYSTYSIQVQKDSTYADEASNFVDGNLAGVLQKIGTKAEWGLEFFNYGNGSGKSGGYIANDIDDSNLTDIVNSIQTRNAENWTPLAESFYVAMTYFQQGTLASGLDYHAGDELGADPWKDVIDGTTTEIPCAKAFVILLTDGASTHDLQIPNAYKDYADSFNSAAYNTFMSTHHFTDNGTDYLKDLALYARQNDLRPDLVDLPYQNIVLYPIFAFADTSTTDGQLADMLLKEAAKNGGYVDRDTTPGPSIQEEWDNDGDGVPDTYYRADNGYELETQILNAINAILERSASGTSVSVLSTSGGGDGIITQAFFKPIITDEYHDIQWTGYLQSTWIDKYGNMREDTGADQILNPAEDDIIVHYFDNSLDEARVKRYHVSAGTPYPEIDESTPADEIIKLNEVKSIWEAGSMLAERDASTRKIFTYIDENNDGTDEMVDFNTTDATTIDKITPYLGVRSSTAWSYLNSPSVSTETDRATNLISYIRGVDESWLRLRTFDYDNDSVNETWKLGDIVNSTPVTVALPSENYQHLYKDESFLNFYKSMVGRETMIYVGANDGMLHAFTSGVYDATAKQFVKKSSTTENIGDELWAYVPQNLLPHLKWLPSEDYSHVFYMDLKPRVFSAKILPDTDSDGVDEWGTILVTGFNLGGGDISVQADFNHDGDDTDTGDLREFRPAYVAINITDPRNPEVLWERSYADLQMSSSVPSIIKVKDKWLLAFGSGPDTCACENSSSNTNKGHLYIVDLKTGEPYKSGTNDWLFETGESRAFLGSPAALDKGLNYSVDSIYVGESYFTSSTDDALKGKLYKVSIPYTGDMDYYGSDITQYDDTPANWEFNPLFTIDRPITVEPTMSMGENDNVWIYFGTGRYLNSDDKLDTSSQYLIGIKDPFFNKEHGGTGTFYHDNIYHDYLEAAAKVLSLSNLLVSDNYTVETGGNGKVTGPDLSGTTYFKDLKNLVYDHDRGTYASKGKEGWYTTMTGGERIVVSPTVFGGTVLAPSFTPDVTTCKSGGTSAMFGLYYETGTKFYVPIFNPDQKKIDLGTGKASEVEIQWTPDDTDQNIRAYTQKSTGEIDVEDATTALGFRSGIKFWNEK